jgi:hypothetical protein
MVTITCQTKDCQNENVEFNFFGEPDFVVCGQCLSKIQGTDLRPDPELPANLHP